MSSSEDEDYEPEKKKNKRKVDNSKYDEDKKKKKRKVDASKFIETEAVSGSDEESDIDYEIDPREREQAEKYKHELDEQIRARQMEQRAFNEMDPEKIVERLNRKVQQSVESEEINEISQQSLLPGVNDPKLWLIKCRIGHEREACISLLNKAYTKQRENEPLLILSATSNENLKGFIYLEAEKEIHVRQAVSGIRLLNINSIKLVPLKEMVDIYTLDRGSKATIEKGMFVRVKTGTYKGDLGQVYDFEDQRRPVTVRLVPRLHPPGSIVNKNHRPPPRLFNSADYPGTDRRRHPVLQEIFEFWNGNQFKDGYIYKQISAKNLQLQDINPKLEEVQSLTNNENDEEAKWSIRQYKINFSKGDKIKVLKGDLKNLTGVVLAASDNIVIMQPNVEEIKDQLQFYKDQVGKYFDEGDHVKVIDGRFIGETGLVIHKQNDESVSIFSDIHKKELTVLMQNLQLSNEGTSQVDQSNKYKIYDIITSKNSDQVGMIIKVEKSALRVILTNGSLATVPFHDVLKKFQPRNACTADKEGNSINIGDMVRVIHQNSPFKGKIATVKNITRQILFLQSTERSEGGIFVERAKLVSILGRSNANKEQNKVTENPRLTREELIGKIVQVIQGPYKGKTGKVQYGDAKFLRVELSNEFRTISIEKSKVRQIESITNTLAIQHNSDPMARAAIRSPGWGVGQATPAYEVQSPWREPTPMRDTEPWRN